MASAAVAAPIVYCCFVFEALKKIKMSCRNSLSGRARSMRQWPSSTGSRLDFDDRGTCSRSSTAGLRVARARRPRGSSVGLPRNAAMGSICAMFSAFSPGSTASDCRRHGRRRDQAPPAPGDPHTDRKASSPTANGNGMLIRALRAPALMGYTAVRYQRNIGCPSGNQDARSGHGPGRIRTYDQGIMSPLH